MTTPRPTASFFHNFVLLAIGRLSRWTAYVSVPHHDVIAETLRLASIDPLTTTWPLKGRRGLHRVIGFAVRNQCRAHCGSRPALCTILGSGQWALTALGVEAAQDLQQQPDTQPDAGGPNTTSRWLEQHYKPLYERLHSYLGRELPRSRELNKVDDHIHNFLSHLIRRDSLRSRLEAGKNISYGQVCAWARPSAVTDLRGEGTEPVCRLHGALTQREQDLDLYDPMGWTEQVIPTTINTIDGVLGVNTYASHDDDGVVADPMSFVVADDDVEAEVLDEDAFNEALKAVGAALEAEISEEADPDLHMDVLKDRFILGMTVREIAEKHDVHRNVMTVAMSRIRRAVAAHRDEIEEEFLR